MRIYHSTFAICIVFFMISSVFLSNYKHNQEGESSTVQNKLGLDEDRCLFNCDWLEEGQSKDGIPSIDEPQYTKSPSKNSHTINELVLGIVMGEQAIAYPYNILNWHEIVNDVFDGVHFSITYCPLTASGMLFKTEILNDSELGTSGLLYENNLVFYDRNTDTYWSQMMARSVKGERVGDYIEPSYSLETTWEAWFSLYPDTWLLSDDTGYNRDYDRYPYGSYKTDSSLYFPSSFDPTIFPFNLHHEKEMTHIVDVNQKKALIPFEVLNNLKVLNFELSGKSLVTFYSTDFKLALTYQRPILNDQTLEFSLNQDTIISNSLSFGMPTFYDNQGNIWNILGNDILDQTNIILEPVVTFNAFWFAASVFFYNGLIFMEDGTSRQVYSDFTPVYTKASKVPAVWFSQVIMILISIKLMKSRQRNVN